MSQESVYIEKKQLDQALLHLPHLHAQVRIKPPSEPSLNSDKSLPPVPRLKRD